MARINPWSGSGSGSSPREAAKPAGALYTPHLDIHETPEGLVLEADLPGVSPKDLEVRLEHNVLTIYGKVRWSQLPEGAQLVYEEIRPGDYYRSFILSDGVDTERISADFNNGVLRLTLPKAAKSLPRKIEVRVAGSEQGGEPKP
jgi:HSP20 family molecular chaperone IbpA